MAGNCRPWTSRLPWPACREVLPVLAGMPRLQALNLQAVLLSEQQQRKVRIRLPCCTTTFG